MSKTAEQKALEAYPTPLDDSPFVSKGFIDEKRREGYIVGYDQAMQDFLEKAEMYLRYRVYYNTHPNNINVAIEDFKNYMQNESEK